MLRDQGRISVLQHVSIDLVVRWRSQLSNNRWDMGGDDGIELEVSFRGYRLKPALIAKVVEAPEDVQVAQEVHVIWEEV